jgi:hypothetical protein
MAPPEAAAQSATRPWLERHLVLLVFVVHLVLVLSLVSRHDRLASRPILNGDYTAHYYAAAHAGDHLLRRQALWGYDPFWMAGYVEGLISLIDNKLPLAVLAAVPAGARPLAFNAVVLGALLALPLLSSVAARLGNRSGTESALAALAATVVTFTVPLVAFFWAGGAISFVLASALVVPVGLGLAAIINEGSVVRLRAMAWLAAAMLTLAVHPAVLPVLGAEILPAIALTQRRSARVAWLLVLSVAFVLPLWPALAAADFAARQSGSFGAMASTWASTPFLQGGISRLWQDWAAHLLQTKPGWDGGAGGLVALAALSLFRGSTARDERRQTWVPSIVAAVAVCLVLAYGVSRFDWFRFTQPYRFLVPLGFLLCLPAGRGAYRLLLEVTRGSPRAWLGTAFLLLVLAQSGRASFGARLATGDDAAENALVSFLERAAKSDDRVLVQSRSTPLPAYPGARETIYANRFALLPLRSGLECLGYTGTSYLGAERYAAFSYGNLFGQRIDSLTPARLRALLGRYAISWLVACDAAPKQSLARFAEVLEYAETAEDCWIFRVREPDASRVLEGSARVTASPDRIDVADAAGERLVLKYHWAPILRAEPPVRLERAPQPGSPVGFIAAYPQGRSAFTIFAAGSLR